MDRDEANSKLNLVLVLITISGIIIAIRANTPPEISYLFALFLLMAITYYVYTNFRIIRNVKNKYAIFVISLLASSLFSGFFSYYTGIELWQATQITSTSFFTGLIYLLLVILLTVALIDNDMIPNFRNRNKLYKGVIIEESLMDKSAISKLKVLDSIISPGNHWHRYTVEVSEDDIVRISHNLYSQQWYAHFWKGMEVTVAFKDKIFKLVYNKKETWKTAVDYGLSIGIPREQLDFPID